MRAALLLAVLLLWLPVLAQDQSLSLETLMTRGNALFESDEFEGALADAEAALKLAPENFEALVLMGRALGKSGKPAQAVPFLERAIGLQPDDAVVMQALSVAYFETDDAARGGPLLDRAIELYPDRAQLYYNRGYFGFRDRDSLAPQQIEAVLGDFARAQELNPTGPEAWGASGWVKWRFTTEPASAMGDYNRAIELGPQALDYRNRALLYLDLQQTDRAEEDLKRALELGADPATMDSIQVLLEMLKAP